jgi:hypothetical protein
MSSYLKPLNASSLHLLSGGKLTEDLKNAAFRDMSVMRFILSTNQGASGSFTLKRERTRSFEMFVLTRTTPRRRTLEELATLLHNFRNIYCKPIEA